MADVGGAAFYAVLAPLACVAAERRPGGTAVRRGPLLRLVFIALSAALSSVLMAGCSGGGGPSVPESSTSPSLEVDESDRAEQAALAAYRGMWDAFVKAGRTSNPDEPDLRRYADGDALRLIVSSLYGNREQGKITLGEISADPKIARLNLQDAPTEATVSDCVDDTKWLVHRTTGEPVTGGQPGGRHRNTAVVKKTNGTWKVTSFTLLRIGTC